MSGTTYGFPYGRKELSLDIHGAIAVEPREEVALPQAREAFLAAIRHPIGGGPSLRDQIRQKEKICIVFTDISRPTPNHLIVPWILEEIAVDPERVTLINALGSHEPNSREELIQMLGKDVLDRYRVLNHDAVTESELSFRGKTSRGTPVWVNRHFVESDFRIVTGFIEPHFFAGFSGGPKGVIPGVAGLKTIQANHRPAHLLDSRATFGITEENPLWEDLSESVSLCGDFFLINVTLNRQKQLTGVLAGERLAAHREGIKRVREGSMVALEERVDVVIATNSGYPLDQNLYQVVKGYCAASQMVREGGDILMLAACERGVPPGSPFDLQMRQIQDWDQEMVRLSTMTDAELESWQVLKMGWVLQKARCWLKSEMPSETVRAMHLRPFESVEKTLHELEREKGRSLKVGLLPMGPLTIPYLSHQESSR